MTGGRSRRQANSARPTVAILGAGAGGIAMAIALQRAGIDTFTIFEMNDGVGGTWRDNTYPGAACDVMSHLYSFSFAPKRDWSRTYAQQPEILRYLEECADAHGLRDHLRVGMPIRRAEWDENTSQWSLVAESGEVLVFDVVISALGMLNVPAVAAIKGLERFCGPVFHSARWRHDVDLEGARVAVIGTGSSAIQFVPAIAPFVDALYVYQRSPGWIVPKVDRPYTDAELTRFRRVPFAARIERARIFLRAERYTAVRPGRRTHRQLTSLSLSYLDRKVKDPELRSRLTPDYPLGCKRLLFTNEWYGALSQPNVELVPIAVREVGERVVITEDGEAREVDVLILGTGFAATEFLSQIEVWGPGGRRLRDAWAGGAEAFLGVATTGFPNLFMLYGPNTNQGGNSMIFVLERQAALIARLVRRMARRNRRTVEVRAGTQRRFNRRLQRRMRQTVWTEDCQSYFKMPNGKVTTQWPYTATRYWLETRLAAPHQFQWTR